MTASNAENNIYIMLIGGVIVFAATPIIERVNAHNSFTRFMYSIFNLQWRKIYSVMYCRKHDKEMCVGLPYRQFEKP
jgi:hypothetical protein